jgi:hypothetical protein
VDSTILADAVAAQDTVTQLVAAIRKVARVVPGAVEQVAAVCTGHDYSKPGQPEIDWDDPPAQDALVWALVNDANALVAALQDRGLDEQAASGLALLALAAGQDVEAAEGRHSREPSAAAAGDQQRRDPAQRRGVLHASLQAAGMVAGGQVLHVEQQRHQRGSGQAGRHPVSIVKAQNAGVSTPPSLVMFGCSMAPRPDGRRRRRSGWGLRCRSLPGRWPAGRLRAGPGPWPVTGAVPARQRCRRAP